MLSGRPTSPASSFTSMEPVAKELRSALGRFDSADPYPPAFLNEEFIYFQPLKRPAEFLS